MSLKYGSFELKRGFGQFGLFSVSKIVVLKLLTIYEWVISV